MLINYPFLIKILTGALLNINYNTKGWTRLEGIVYGQLFCKNLVFALVGLRLLKQNDKRPSNFKHR